MFDTPLHLQAARDEPKEYTTEYFYWYMIATNLTLFPAGVGAIIYISWHTIRNKTYRFHFRFTLAIVAMLMAYITQIVWANHLYP